MLIAWYIGLACRLGLLARLVPWARRLPWFSLLILVYVIQSIGTRVLMHDNDAANRWTNVLGPVYCGVRILAFVEAMTWLARQLPRFRVIGYVWLTLCSAIGVAVQLYWRPQTIDSPWLWLASIERFTGIGIAAALAVGLIGYGWARAPLPRIPQFRAAVGHSIVLGLWSACDAIGWMRIQQASGIPRELANARREAFQQAGLIIVAASILFPIAWLLLVRTAPEWQEPDPVGSAEDARSDIKQMRVGIH